MLAAVEERRQRMGSKLDPKRRSALGQYFTPATTARFIASFLVALPQRPTVRLLDPGAGIGSLAAAAVEQLVTCRRPELAAVHVVAYELDQELHPGLRATLDDCIDWARQHGVTLTADLRRENYVLAAAGSRKSEAYEAVIVNPPYKKVAASSAERKALEAVGVRVANLYTAFVALGVSQLASGGVLAAITPRSFANGLYHEPFRRFLFDAAALERLHVFDSRSVVFSDSDVLQENVIFSARRGRPQSRVAISVSHGSDDEPLVREVPAAEVIRPDDRHRFLRIPTAEEDTAIAECMAELDATLEDLGLAVSTGRVVDFRARPYLRDQPAPDAVPLIYPGNLRDGRVTWPANNGSRKPTAISAAPETESLLLPNEPFVLVKRFTSKEERRRVTAALSLPDDLPGSVVAFENHLNVFHRRGAGLDETLGRGLAAYLNSTFVDRFVRVFSGHTQINATDLRNLRYPSREQLMRLGESVTPQPDQVRLDGLVTQAVPALAGEAERGR